MILSHIFLDHNPVLLVLSAGICLLGAGTGMVLWRRLLCTRGHSVGDWGFLVAVVLGATIWTTHFVAMLGYSGSAGASFDLLLTALSVGAAIMGIALTVVLTVLLRGWHADLAGGVALGAAISFMHFTGMLGFRVGVDLAWSTIWVPEAVLAGAVVGVAAIRLLRQTVEGDLHPRYAAVAFTFAVVCVHFIAMAIYHERVAPTLFSHEPVNHTGLAVAVTLVTFVLIGTAVSGFIIQDRMSSNAAAQLERSAREDSLTGISNRGALNTVLGELCDGLNDGGRSFALLFVDLDRFKPVNDGFGHPIGDEVLRRVVRRLSASVRQSDFIARLGGDEFAVIVRNIPPGAEETDRIAERIVDLMSRPFLIDTRVIEIGASLGIAEPALGQATDPLSLIRNADMALYEAKASGRGTWRRFEPAIAERFEERRLLEYDLRRAVARNEFEMYYQAVVDSETGDCIGAEALLRWHHPSRGLLSPNSFIFLAEELGLVVQIGKWVLENACRTASAWPEELKVSVNLSPVQLRDSRIVQSVREALDKSGLDPARLEVEITETALLDNEELGINVLHQLRALGVSVSLDDFGTGFSSLSHLHKFPLDRIKIDQSFVKMAESDPKSAKIVEAIGSLGDALGLGVTAEGVETEGQLILARGKGCDVIQGYLISKPVSDADFVTALKTSNARKAS